MSSTVNSTKLLREKMIPILYNLFYPIEAEGILANSFNEASLTLLSKSDKCHKKVKLLTNNLS